MTLSFEFEQTHLVSQQCIVHQCTRDITSCCFPGCRINEHNLYLMYLPCCYASQLDALINYS